MQEMHKKEGGGFSIQRLPPGNPSNERGQRTWNWKMPEGTQVSAYLRLKDEYFGNHFHKGDDPSKNPELFLLLSGAMKVELLDKLGNYSTALLNADSGPVELVIQPWNLHRMKAIEEIRYVEYRKTIFNPESPDTYPPEDFPYHFKD